MDLFHIMEKVSFLLFLVMILPLFIIYVDIYVIIILLFPLDYDISSFEIINSKFVLELENMKIISIESGEIW
jgi:hypothetical protein